MKKHNNYIVLTFFTLTSMKNIGFYILDNIYIKKLSETIPSLCYYDTGIEVYVKEDSPQYSKFTPDISLTDDEGHVNVYYITLILNKLTQTEKKQVLNQIFMFNKMNDIYYMKEIYYLMMTSALFFFPNTDFTIQYFDKMGKLGVLTSNFVLSYFDNRYTINFIKQFNEVLSRHKLSELSLKYKHHNSILIDMRLQIINAYKFSNTLRKPSVIKTRDNKIRKLMIDNIQKHTSVLIWEYSPGIILKEYYNIMEFGLMIYSDFRLMIQNILVQISGNYSNSNLKNLLKKHKFNKKFSFENVKINLSHTYDLSNDVLLTSIISVLKLCKKIITHYCKYHNIEVNNANLRQDIPYMDIMFPINNNIHPSAHYNINNYLYGHKYILEYDNVIQIPFTNIEAQKNEGVNLNHTPSLYNFSETYR